MIFKKIRIPLILLLSITAAITGWMMYSRSEEEALWGYLPLWFFIGCWGAIVLTFASKNEETIKWLGLSTLSGILLSAGFPPIPLTILMFVGFVPLLLAEQEITDKAEKKSARRVFFYAYHAFVVWNILTTYWVANTAFFAGIFAIWVNSLFMSIPFVLFHLVKKRLPNLGWKAFVAFWLTFELLHMNHQLSWPWLTLGNSLSEFPSWIQWYEYTGVFGGSLWILMANVLFYKVMRNYYVHKTGITLKKIAQPLALLLIPLILSLGMYFSYDEQGREIEMVVTQPNFEPHYDKNKLTKKEEYDVPMGLSFAAATKETDYIILPESSFGPLDEKTISKNKLIKTIRGNLADFPKTKIIMGVGSYRFFEEGESWTPAVREYIRALGTRNDTSYYESYNTAIQVSNETEAVDIYHKSLLVPGAEFFPLKNIFPFMKPLVDKLGGSVAGLGKQKKRSVFMSEDGIRIAPVICYESVYGAYTTGYVRNGANALVIMTNDGWWDNTAGHRQHLQFATMRAIETRRGIARSANTGISGFINQRGDILETSKYNEAIALNGKIKLNETYTFYTQWGDLIARIASFLAILILLNFIAKTWLRKAEKGAK